MSAASVSACGKIDFAEINIKDMFFRFNTRREAELFKSFILNGEAISVPRSDYTKIACFQ